MKKRKSTRRKIIIRSKDDIDKYFGKAKGEKEEKIRMWWDGRDTEKELEDKKKRTGNILVRDANEHIVRLRRKLKYDT